MSYHVYIIDLSFRWAHMPLCWFCHEVAHFYSAFIYIKQEFGGTKAYELQISADEKSVVSDYCNRTATKVAVSMCP